MEKLGQKPKPPGDQIEAEFTERKGLLTTRSLDIKTLADALRVSKVDLKVWEVERYVCNSWEVTMGSVKTGTERAETYTNYQVKVWLRRILPTVLETAMERLLKRLEMGKFGKQKTEIKKPEPGARRYLLELSLMDAHFALLAWNRETGDDYDLKEAERSYAVTVEDLLVKTAGCQPEKILLPIGNDFFHVNNPEGMTPRGHNILDVDGRLCKVVEVGERAIIQAIQRCLHVAPVQVLWIPGNHDPETSYFLCRTLKAYFAANPDVVVDVSPPPRKYFRYGCNLIGFTHGNEERHGDLPTIMATERREDWSACRHFEWHVGHVHKKRETRYSAGDTYGGVQVKTIPSISGTDAWHFKKGYVKGNRIAQAFLFDFERGPVATYDSFDLRYLATKEHKEHTETEESTANERQ